MSRRFLAAVAFLGLVWACYNPDLSKTHYTCTPAEPVCPDTYVCDGAHCVPPGSPPADLSVSDVALPPPADQRPPHGCASGRGAPVGMGAWACPGLYDPGHVRAMCAPGFEICKSAAGVDLSICRTTNGFYIADVRGYDERKDCSTDASAVLCSYINNRERPLWFGCGSLTGYQQICRRGCSGFVQANNGSIAATIPGPPFVDSFTSDIDEQTNNVSTNGVLCCAK